jgi:hypothetical protein
MRLRDRAALARKQRKQIASSGLASYRQALASVAMLLLLLVSAARVHAHSGPPFPILSDQHAGPYIISIWTDPDATDDGKAAGQFWIVIHPVDAAKTIPDGTRAHVAIRPSDRAGAEHAAQAAPVDGLITRQFVALLMDHEGRFAVRVTVDGPLGVSHVTSDVDATYDARPAPILLVVYLVPFLAIGGLWIALLRRRTRVRF